MSTIEQAALLVVSIFGFGLYAVIKFLTSKVSRLESRVNQRRVEDLGRDAHEILSKKSNADIIKFLNDESEPRSGGRE